MSFNTRQISHSFWIDQINAGIDYRRKYAKEDKWNDYRSYYRGNWLPGVLPLNFFFMLMRAIVPRVYFKNPSVSIVPAMPGLECAVFAQLLERIDNKLFTQMKLKKQIKKMVQDSFMFGTGVGKLGLGGVYTPSPTYSGAIVPSLEKKGRIEYKAGTADNMPWFGRMQTGDFIVPSGCEDIDDAMWVAHRVERYIDDVKSDPRLKFTKDLVATRLTSYQRGGRVVNLQKPIDTIELFEIRDRKFGRVFVLSPDHQKILYEGPDLLQTREGFNFFPLIFNNDDEVFWGVPDAAILEPQQLEANEVRTQTMKHRRLTLLKILYETGAIEEPELKKMLSESVGAGVQVNDITKVKPMQVAGIPADLLASAEQVRADIRETLGFSRNQMGELSQKSGDTTATEASIVQMASEIRVDERRDMVADLLCNIANAMNEVLFKTWTGEQIVDIAGPGGVRVWVAFSAEMLRGGAYEVSIDADTSLPLSRTAREQKAIQVYGLLKENPLVDPMLLTKYLLREMHGCQYDDLMRGLPTGVGLASPMNVGQFGQLLQNGQRLGLPMPAQNQDMIKK